MQFLKLGAAAALPGLSEHFVIWDLDMVPLKPLRLLWPPPPGAPLGAPLQVTEYCIGASGEMRLGFGLVCPGLCW